MASNRYQCIYFATACLLFALFLSAPAALKAQTSLASLQGVVSDASGAVVPGAAVDVVNEATGLKQTQKTDPRGYYFFEFLPPGNYRLTVTMTGFETFVESGMPLHVQQMARVDVTLKPGAVATKVVVTGEAPRLDTTTATQGQVISNNEMLNLPNIGRDAQLLIQLSPNVVGVGGHMNEGIIASSFNGGRLGGTDLLLDGVTTNVQDSLSGAFDNRYSPKEDIVQEMKVQTNQFSAEYGMTGSAVVSMVSRSGTNGLHGDVYDYHNDQHLNAQDWFDNLYGVKKAVGRENQIGGLVGGPVLLPHIYDGRNKSFFFYHLEKRSLGTSAFTDWETVPTAMEHQGNFSQTENTNGIPVQIFNPHTYNADSCATYTFNGTAQQVCGLRSQYSGNIIPQAQWDPVGSHVLPFYPAATSAGQGPAHINNYHFVGTQGVPWYQEDIKGDEIFTSNQRISVRYSRTPNSSLTNQDAWGPNNYMVPYTGNPWKYTYGQQQVTGNYTNTLSATTVLNVQAGVIRFKSSGGLEFQNDNWDATTWGYANRLGLTRPPVYWTDEDSLIGPDVWAGSYGVAGESQTTDQISGSLTKVKGKHTFKAGAEERFTFLNESSPGMNTGGFDVCEAGTAAIPSGETPDNMNWGFSIATFLAGWGGNCMLDGGFVGTSMAVATGARQSALYIADDIRAKRNLTLSVGLRYELNWPYSERWNRLTYWDQEQGSGLNGLLSSEGLPLLMGAPVYTNANHRHVFGTDWHDFAPRFGLSWQFKPKWVARGGYGYFYSIPSNQVNNFVADGYTTSTAYIWSNDDGASLLSPFDNPLPNGLTPAYGSAIGSALDLGNTLPGNGYIADYNNKLTPRVQQWSLSIERELPGNGVVEFGYTGAHGYHLADGNSLGLYKAFPVADLQYGCMLDGGTCVGHTSSSGVLPDGTVVTNGMVNNPWYPALTAVAPGSAMDTPTIALYQYLGNNPEYYGLTVGPGLPLGKSWYDSGFVRYTRHMAKGLQFTAHYTWSKALSNSETANDGNLDWINCGAGACMQDGTGIQAQDWENFALEKSVTLNDITHRVIADGVYELPFGRGRSFGAQWNRALDAVAGGWRASAVLTLQSGAPITPHLNGGGDLGNPAAGFTQRPNLIGNPVTSGSVESRLGQTGQQLYLNPNAFSTPEPYTFGTAPRILNNARAPGLRQMDMAMFKEVYFTENRSRYLQFRAEASNLTNHPVFGYPGSVVNGGGFGVISSLANGPRGILVTMKLFF